VALLKIENGVSGISLCKKGPLRLELNDPSSQSSACQKDTSVERSVVSHLNGSFSGAWCREASEREPERDRVIRKRRIPCNYKFSGGGRGSVLQRTADHIGWL
jgi:hypothetical protein